MVNGFVVGITLTDSGCGYTNPPAVSIQGGGGTGATATAVISNGVVANIIINNAGGGLFQHADGVHLFPSGASARFN